MQKHLAHPSQETARYSAIAVVVCSITALVSGVLSFWVDEAVLVGMVAFVLMVAAISIGSRAPHDSEEPQGKTIPKPTSSNTRTDVNL